MIQTTNTDRPTRKTLASQLDRLDGILDCLGEGLNQAVASAVREAGLRYPVALTSAAWARCVAVPPGVECQDEAGRLRDVLFLLACAIRRAGNGPEVQFAVHVRNGNRQRTPPLVRLKALCGPGDAGEPVITVMQPDED